MWIESQKLLDNGQPFPNPVKERLPTIQESSSALTSLEAGLQAPPARTRGIIR